jgi:hypothetical protein
MYVDHGCVFLCVLVFDVCVRALVFTVVQKPTLIQGD